MDESAEHLEIVDQLINQIHNQQRKLVDERHHEVGGGQHLHKVGRGDAGGKRGNSHRTFQPSGHKKLSSAIPRSTGALSPGLALNFGYHSLSEPNNLATSAVTYSAKAKLNIVHRVDVVEGGRNAPEGPPPPPSTTTTLPSAGSMRCNKCQYHFVEGKFVPKGECVHQHYQQHRKKAMASGGGGLALSLNVPRVDGEVGGAAAYNALLPTPGRLFINGHSSGDYYCTSPSRGGGPRNRSFYNRTKMLHLSMARAGEGQSRSSNYWGSNTLPGNRKTNAPALWSLSTPDFELPEVDAERWEAMHRCVIDEDASGKEKSYGPLADVMIENGMLQIVPCSEEEEEEEAAAEKSEKDEDVEKESKEGEEILTKEEDNITSSTEGMQQLNPKVLELFKHFESIESSQQQYISLMPRPQEALGLSSLSTFIKKVAATNQSPSTSVEPLDRGNSSFSANHQPMSSRRIRSGGFYSSAMPSPPSTRRLSRMVAPFTSVVPTTTTTTKNNLTPPLSPSSMHELRSLAKTFKTIEIGDWKVNSKSLDLGSIDFEPLGFADFDGRNVTLYKYIGYVNQHRKRFIQPSVELLKMLLNEEVKRDQMIDEDGGDSGDDEGSVLPAEPNEDEHNFELSEYYEKENAQTYEKKYAYSVLDQLINEEPELARQVKEQAYRFLEHTSDDGNDDEPAEDEEPEMLQGNKARARGRFSPVVAPEPFAVDQSLIKHSSYADLQQRRATSSEIVVSDDKKICLPEVLIRQLRENPSSIEDVFLQAKFVTEVSFV